MNDLLDILDKEEKQRIKNFKVEINRNIEDIISFFETAVEQNECYHYQEWNNAVKKSNLNYSASDLSCLPIFMQSYLERCNYHVGIFLSVLVNNCKDDDISINIPQTPINHFAVCNTKNLTVVGNVGEFFCMSMVSGNVKLIGNAGEYFGQDFNGGEILVQGDVGFSCASYMKSGKIIVNGNCDGCVGRNMHDGTLIVNGNVSSQLGYEMSNGKIIIEGNAKDQVGERMHNGSIVVKGNALDEIGKNMWGGKITILGNAGYEVGIGMCGGQDSKIFLGGNFGSISGLTNKEWSYWRGKIYHKNKLIFKDGNPVIPNYLNLYKKYEWYTLKK